MNLRIDSLVSLEEAATALAQGLSDRGDKRAPLSLGGRFVRDVVREHFVGCGRLVVGTVEARELVTIDHYRAVGRAFNYTEA